MPELHCSVVTPAGQNSVLRVKSQTPDEVVVLKRIQQRAAAYVPELHRFIKTSARQNLALWIKCQTRNKIFMVIKPAQSLPRARFPEHHRPIITPSGKHVTPRMKSYT